MSPLSHRNALRDGLGPFPDVSSAGGGWARRDGIRRTPGMAGGGFAGGEEVRRGEVCGKWEESANGCWSDATMDGCNYNQNINARRGWRVPSDMHPCIQRCPTHSKTDDSARARFCESWIVLRECTNERKQLRTHG